MTYEEKRELRLQISQMLADAGINQAVLKDMVAQTINARVERAVDQCMKRLNSESSSGDFVRDYINSRITDNFWSERYIRNAVFKAIEDKTLKITLVGCGVEKRGEQEGE